MPLMTRRYNMYTDSWRCCVAPFNSFSNPPSPACRHPSVREELLAFRHPTFVPSLISRLFFLSIPALVLFYFYFFISVSSRCCLASGLNLKSAFCVRAVFCNYRSGVLSKCHSYFLLLLFFLLPFLYLALLSLLFSAVGNILYFLSV